MAGKIKARVCFASLICTLMLLLTSCGFRLMSKREVEEYLEKQYGQKFTVIKSLQSSLCFWLCLALLQHFTYWQSFGESRICCRQNWRYSSNYRNNRGNCITYSCRIRDHANICFLACCHSCVVWFYNGCNWIFQ